MSTERSVRIQETYRKLEAKPVYFTQVSVTSAKKNNIGLKRTGKASGVMSLHDKNNTPLMKTEIPEWPSTTGLADLKTFGH